MSWFTPMPKDAVVPYCQTTCSVVPGDCEDAAEARDVAAVADEDARLAAEGRGFGGMV